MSEMTAGLEIHQQLDMHKLFCSCPSRLVEEEGPILVRRLRPAQSEMGKVDRAALAEAKKKLRFRYQSPPGVSCLVEADEEPPHRADEEAIDVVLTVSALLGADVVDEIHFMRKIVIDGSNTTGFQRTALVAMNGSIDLDGRSVSISSVCLEEDAARKVEVGRGVVTYKLDRLGIPLIEVATGPELHSPEEVMKAAEMLGSMMRATRRVKRGLGTIREDLNISIPEGARVEIKGVQELRMLPLYVENEVERQRSLVEIRDLLKSRGTNPVEERIVDVSDLFLDTDSKVISSSLGSKGRVMAIALPGFAGVLRSEDKRLRLGSEMAQRARTRGVKGIFHSDELPSYGITGEEVEALRSHLSLEEGDAFAICSERRERAVSALQAVLERANEALEGVPEETRDPLPDGTTRYSRPLPGAERMYPETDVPPITISADRRERIMESLPELPRERAARLASETGIHAQLADQMVREGTDIIFEEVVSIDPSLSGVAATTLTSTFTEIEREGLSPLEIPGERIMSTFQCLSKGDYAKEALPDIFRMLAKGSTMEDAVRELGLESICDEDASEIIARIVKEREDFVTEKGMGSVGPLMGVVMEELKGKVDGKRASELLQTEIKRLME
jgi:glutamyl-tRNA(Gln) amidotransferase subunit E